MAKQEKQALTLTEQLIIKTITQLQDNISLHIHHVEEQFEFCAIEDDVYLENKQELELLELERRILDEIRDDADRIPANRLHHGIRSVIELCLQVELDKPAAQTDRQTLNLAAEQLDEQAALLLDGFADSAAEETALKAKSDLFTQLAENVRQNMPERRSEKRKATSGALFDAEEVLKLD